MYILYMYIISIFIYIVLRQQQKQNKHKVWTNFLIYIKSYASCIFGNFSEHTSERQFVNTMTIALMIFGYTQGDIL